MIALSLAQEMKVFTHTCAQLLGPQLRTFYMFSLVAGDSVFIGTGKFLAAIEVRNIRDKRNVFKQARAILIRLLQKSEFPN